MQHHDRWLTLTIARWSVNKNVPSFGDAQSSFEVANRWVARGHVLCRMAVERQHVFRTDSTTFGFNFKHGASFVIWMSSTSVTWRGQGCDAAYPTCIAPCNLTFAQSREEKRWMERQNAKKQAGKKKEEAARIRR